MTAGAWDAGGKKLGLHFSYGKSMSLWVVL